MKLFGKWFFLFLLPFFALLFSHLSVYAQWTVITPPELGASWELLSVHFTSADEGWAVGSKGSNDYSGVLLHYKNGIWTSITPPAVVSTRWQLLGVHFTSADEGWAVGSDDINGSGVLLHYKNETWTSVTPPAVSGWWNLYGVHFTSADEGWAVGVDGRNFSGVLLHYQNGIWTSVTPPVVNGGWNLYGVHFTLADEGWAVGIGQDKGIYNGVLLHYQNGIWTSVTPPVVSGNWELEEVHFTSADEGWAVGDHHSGSGVLLHYQNGIWTPAVPPAVSGSWFFTGIHFTSADEGWAVGIDSENSRGALFHYQKGIWSLVTSPEVNGGWAPRAVHFTSATEGWVVGRENRGGALLHYAVGVSPYNGTIGTMLTITGLDFGAKKGKVLVGGLAAKIEKDGWKPDSVTCILTKVLSAGTHDVKVKPYYNADGIILSNAFTVKAPEIDSLNSYIGTGGITPITISGKFFGTKKGKVYLEDINTGKKKNCKVTSWGMDSISFIVPKTSKSFPSGTYHLKVMNKVGTAEAPSDFTID